MRLCEVRLVEVRLSDAVVEVRTKQPLVAPAPGTPLDGDVVQHATRVQVALHLVPQLLGPRLVHLQVFAAQLPSTRLRLGHLLQLEDALLVEEDRLHDVTRLLAL